jgi:membrane protease YdiL (CAAX protease family)
MKKQKLFFAPDLLTGRLTEEDTKKYFSRFGWFAFATFMIYMVTVSILSTIIYEVAPDVYYHHLFLNLSSVIPLYCVALPLGYLVLRPLPSVMPKPSSADGKTKFGFKGGFFSICICLTLMMLGSYISQIFMTFFQILRQDIIENPLEEVLNNTPIWSVILFTVILAPILEEVLFRGIVCKKLLALGEGYAIVASAVLFAVFHGNFYQLFYAFTLGCFFAFIYVKTGKLRYTILLHMLVNFFGGAIPTMLLSKLNLDLLMEGNIDYVVANIGAILLFLLYELLYYGGAIAGIVIIATQFRKFKIQKTGLLPPPEKRGVRCAIFNAGIITAAALFALNLLGSLAL